MELLNEERFIMTATMDYDKALNAIPLMQLGGHEETIRHALESMKWRPIETAPKDETIFVCRNKKKPHVTFEAAMFWDQESWEIPEKYFVIQNMTTDQPLEDDWDDLEWQELPTPPLDRGGA